MTNTVYLLIEHKTAQPKLRNLEMLTNGHDKSETQIDMVQELIQVETDEMVPNESNSQPVTSGEINEMIENNQNKNMKQIELKLSEVLVV